MYSGYRLCVTSSSAPTSWPRSTKRRYTSGHEGGSHGQAVGDNHISQSVRTENYGYGGCEGRYAALVLINNVLSQVASH